MFFLAHRFEARTTTTAASAYLALSALLRGEEITSELGETPRLLFDPKLASGFVAPLLLEFSITTSQSARPKPDPSRNAPISSAASVSLPTPNGRIKEGSCARSSTASLSRTSEALLCASSATTSATPDSICITAFPRPVMPSPGIVHTALPAPPSWSGTISSVMLQPSQRSSPVVMKESTSFLGSIPASL